MRALRVQLGGLFRPHLALSPGLTSILAGASLVSATSRGLDYIAINACTGDEQTAVERAANQCAPASLSFVERAMPLDLWGLLFLGAAVGALICWLLRFWAGVVLAHFLLALTYVMFGFGSLVAVVSDWTGSGWRSGVGFIMVQGVLHGVLAVAAVREWDRVRSHRNG